MSNSEEIQKNSVKDDQYEIDTLTNDRLIKDHEYDGIRELGLKIKILAARRRFFCHSNCLFPVGKLMWFGYDLQHDYAGSD